MNPFGRGCPGPGEAKPPPTPTVGSIKRDERDKTNEPLSGSVVQHNREFSLFKQQMRKRSQVRKEYTTKPKSQCSQSGKTFVEVTQKEEKKFRMTKTQTQGRLPIVSPDKGSGMSPMTTLTTLARKSTFFSSKRKKSDDEKWTRDRLISELTGLLSTEALSALQVQQQSEQELRKHLYEALSKQKKFKGNDEETMDVGTLLLDSTMEYVPILSENSTDADIEGLEKHDAILELADFIKKCGKRVNFYTLNASTVEELHANIKVARDDHKRVKQVFPDLTGIDSRWFGPKSERTDQDYEPSEANDDALDDAWADLSDDEITDLKNDSEVCDVNDGDNHEKSKVDLEEEHQKLLQELYTQVENKKAPEIHNPVDDSQWSKEKLSEEILKVGRTIGKTHYYSVLMNSSREYLRKQLHSLLVMQKEAPSKEKETPSKKQNKNEKKTKKRK